MKKLLFLSGIVALHTFVGIQAMEQERPMIYRQLDLLLEQQPLNMPAVFAFIDANQGAINVNEYTIGDGMTLLDLAVTYKLFAVAKLLLEKYGANPNIQHKKSKMTPLMWACIRQDIPMIQLLMLYGANPYLKGLDIYAEMHGNPARMIDSFEYARTYAADNPAILNTLNGYNK